MVVMFFIAIVVMLRIVILMPAIAVDAPAVSIGNVFADTRGHAWFILKAYFAVVLLFVLVIVLTAVLAWLGGGSGIFRVPAVQPWRWVQFQFTGISDGDLSHDRPGAAFHEDWRSRERRRRE
jgi:hypothetical protein